MLVELSLFCRLSAPWCSSSSSQEINIQVASFSPLLHTLKGLFQFCVHSIGVRIHTYIVDHFLYHSERKSIQTKSNQVEEWCKVNKNHTKTSVQHFHRLFHCYILLWLHTFNQAVGRPKWSFRSMHVLIQKLSTSPVHLVQDLHLILSL